MPARNIRRWEAISASFGVSRRLGRKNRDRRMASRKRGAAVKPEPAWKYKKIQGRYFFAVCGGQPRDKCPPFDYRCCCAIPKPPSRFTTRFRDGGPSLGRISLGRIPGRVKRLHCHGEDA